MTTRAIIFRLRKHADYQRVYKAGRKQFAKQMTYFFTLRPQLGPDGTPLRDANATSPRVGLTVGKVMGKAVDRNRIKRRMREAVRKNLSTLSAPVDIVLHPRRSVIDLEFSALDREVASVFRAIQNAAEKQQNSPPSHPVPPEAMPDPKPSLAIRITYWLYKSILSPVLHALSPTQCRYLPTCSEYAYVALVRFGVFKGSWLALRRLARCHPFAKGGLDPVPLRNS